MGRWGWRFWRRAPAARTRGAGSARGRKTAAQTAAANAAAAAAAQAQVDQLRFIMQQQQAAARGRGSQRGRGRGKNPTQEKQQRKSKKTEQTERNRLGAFNLWLNDNRETLEARHPDLVGLYFLIEAGKNWCRLPPAQRQLYDIKFRENSESAANSLLEFAFDDFLDDYNEAKTYYDENLTPNKLSI